MQERLALAGTAHHSCRPSRTRRDAGRICGTNRLHEWGAQRCMLLTQWEVCSRW